MLVTCAECPTYFRYFACGDEGEKQSSGEGGGGGCESSGLHLGYKHKKKNNSTRIFFSSVVLCAVAGVRTETRAVAILTLQRKQRRSHCRSQKGERLILARAVGKADLGRGVKFVEVSTEPRLCRGFSLSSNKLGKSGVALVRAGKGYPTDVQPQFRLSAFK